MAAAIFLTINGLSLLAGERLRRTAPTDEEQPNPVPEPVAAGTQVSVTPEAAPRPSRTTRRLTTLSYREAAVIGLFQSFALLAGISRSGITMVGGLARGLSHRDAARFAFLLATPVILAAGVLKLPNLAGSAGDGIHGRVLLGAPVAGIASYTSVRWLTRWFETRTLTPFAIYSLVVGIICIARFA